MFGNLTKKDILDKLNELEWEKENLGETFIECVIEAREEDGLPPFTAEEYESEIKKCNENAERYQELEERQDELKVEYEAKCGFFPRYNYISNRWEQNAKELCKY